MSNPVSAVLKRVGETRNFYVFEDRKSIICNKVYVEKSCFDSVPDAAEFEVRVVKTGPVNVERIG